MPKGYSLNERPWPRVEITCPICGRREFRAMRCNGRPARYCLDCGSLPASELRPRLADAVMALRELSGVALPGDHNRRVKTLLGQMR